jgi:hypothetical protein
MKLILIVGLVAGLTHNTLAKLPEAEANKLVDAIYVIEGGAKTKYPYGIKSITIKGDTEQERVAYARKICWNTVQNQHDRWIKAGSKGDYLESLANRYAPIGAGNDPKGLNNNWLKNLRKVLGK